MSGRIGILSIASRSGENLYANAERLMKHKLSKGQSPSGQVAQGDIFSNPKNNVDLTFNDLKDKGIENFKKIYFLSHGNETCVEINEARKINFSAEELAQKFLKEGGLRDAMERHLKASLSGQQRKVDKSGDFKLDITLLSCLTGKELPKAERQAHFSSARSATFVEDFTKALMREVGKVIQEQKKAQPDAFRSSAFSIKLRGKAPRGWKVIRPDGTTFSYYCPSKQEQRVDTKLQNAFKVIGSKLDSPQNVKEFFLPDHEKSTEVIYAIRKFSNDNQAYTDEPIGPRACK